VPSKQRVWCHQGPDFQKAFSTDRFGLDREPAALSISRPKSLSAKLLPQGAVFLLKVFDHALLVSFDPASEGQHQKLQR
jgi:hypothetical protein